MWNAPRIEISISALQHNLAQVRKLAPAQKIMAVIKANAYGHGIHTVAKCLLDADILAVARVGEGVCLRQTEVARPILILTGILAKSEIDEAVQHKLDLVIHRLDQLGLLLASGKNLRCWLKVDTGMGRLGLTASEYQQAVQRLMDSSCSLQLIGVMTHFSSADDLSDPVTAEQTKRFQALDIPSTIKTSLANSAAIIGWPETHADIVRPGLMLYGVNPMLAGDGKEGLNLKPVMTLKAKVISVKQMRKGQAVGYGGTWVCPEDMSVITVGIGYGDGYPRAAGGQARVLINKQKVKLIGRVSMDSLAIDGRGINVSVGDEVILWGKGMPVERVAEAANTLSYELLCGVTQRVDKVEVA